MQVSSANVAQNLRFLPAEWHPQDAVMLTWPHNETDWANKLPQVEPIFVAIAQAICKQEYCLIVVNNKAHQAHVSQLLTNANVQLIKVLFKIAASNDTWARDHGPIALINKHSPLDVTLLDFQFNGWGNKFPANHDNAITQQVFSQVDFQAQIATQSLVFEGGAIESDGQGHLLTTSACLLNQNRNPTLTKAQLEQTLLSCLGAKKMLWLTSGELEGDDTDAHIDTLCRFAPNNTLVYVACDDINDSHYQSLKLMEAQLKQFTTLSGELFTLLPLPWPSAKYDEDGQRLPATYANYLIINQAVLVPTYQDTQDEMALKIIQQAYPNHQVIGIDCLAIIEQHGSLHCLTMQLPKGTLAQGVSL